MPDTKPNFAEQTDEALVTMARAGDSDAFDELIRRHRARAVGWARSLSPDPFLAEDVVQEALLRAFLHLGQLVDPERFLPWLRQIVRTQALMHLRRGGPFGRERPLTEVARGSDGVDWTDLDSLLTHLAGAPPPTDESPVEHLLQQDFLHSMRSMLHKLTPRERAVFEAHFFQQLSPAEIARLYQISPGHVHNTLTISRKRVREEHIRQYLHEYIRERGDRNAHVSIVLQAHHRRSRSEWRQCRHSIAVAIHLALQGRSQHPFSMTDVMGLTTHAFRLQVETQRVDLSGPNAYFWETILEEGLLNLGATSRYVGDGGMAPSPYLLSQGIAHVEESVGRGAPVIAWDLFTPGFGLIYGYDANEQLLFAEDAKARQPLPYGDLGRGASGGLFLLTVDELLDTPPNRMLYRALSMAVRHAHGERGPTGYVGGLRAYETWRAVLQTGQIDPLGNAQTAALTAEARRYATTFLTDWSQRFDGRLGQILQLAASYYDEVALTLESYRQLFPTPDGGAPGKRNSMEQGARLLGRAQQAEEAGVDALEAATRLLKPQLT